MLFYGTVCDESLSEPFSEEVSEESPDSFWEEESLPLEVFPDDVSAGFESELCVLEASGFCSSGVFSSL